MLAVHGLENVFATALHGQVNELVDAFVFKTFDELVQVKHHVARVSHTKTNLVVAGDFF